MNQQTNHMPAAKIGGHKLKNDFIFIAILLLAVIVVGLAVWLVRGEGTHDELLKNSQTYRDIYASQNREGAMANG